MKTIEVQVDDMTLTLTQKKRCHWVFNGSGRVTGRRQSTHPPHENRLTRETFIALWNLSASVWDCQKKVGKIRKLPNVHLRGTSLTPELRRFAKKLRKEGHILRPLPLWPETGDCTVADYLRKQKKQVIC
tara:strand:- start:368 stop:757 length:390 start_codon:yes stop_codon:yes gene_type:complete